MIDMQFVVFQQDWVMKLPHYTKKLEIFHNLSLHL